jgi:hypothetical protein
MPGGALVRALAGKTGLTGGLSRALASRRLLVHDRGQVLADLACAIADGAEVISDFRVMADQGGMFGLVASVPTCWRALNEIAGGSSRVLVGGGRGVVWRPARDADRAPAGNRRGSSSHAPRVRPLIRPRTWLMPAARQC